MIKRILLVVFFALSGIYFGNDPDQNLRACDTGIAASCSSANSGSWVERSVKEKIENYFSTHVETVEELPVIKHMDPNYIF